MPAATTLSVPGALALSLSFLPLTRDYHKYVLDAQLIPHELLPKISDEIRAKAANLVAKYPRAPRARMFQAEALMQRGDFAGAEQELRKGLAEDEILATKFMPELAIRMKAMLALALTPGISGAHEPPMIRELLNARLPHAVVGRGRRRQLRLARKSRRSFGRLRTRTGLCSQS